MERGINKRGPATNRSVPLVLSQSNGPTDVAPLIAMREWVRRWWRRLMADRERPHDVVECGAVAVEKVAIDGTEVGERRRLVEPTVNVYLLGLAIEPKDKFVRVLAGEEAFGKVVEPLRVLVCSPQLCVYGVEVGGSQGRVLFREREAGTDAAHGAGA